MVIDNLYITCKGCNSRVDIRCKENCHIKCSKCIKQYYVDFCYELYITIYTYKFDNLRSFDLKSIILRRSYVNW